MQFQATLLALATMALALPSAEPDAVSQVCIKFTATEASEMYYSNSGVWGTATGSFASTNGQICVPTNAKAGGAMYIGSYAKPTANNTKLECFFPPTGKGNCDVSLVDGYSLSVACTAAGQPTTIGGAIDLWNGKSKCDDTAEISKGICINKNGYAPSQSEVSTFFQPAVQNGNNYCIWKNCGQDYSFNSGAQVTCHVSGTRESK